MQFESNTSTCPFSKVKKLRQRVLENSEMFVPLQHKSWLICSNLTRLDITPMMSFLLPITEQRGGIP